ncbi:hypothetical protein [Roseateles saccharophilus]|uniref:Uncharacterized protein n=1 Tax=Roseateles saccharophilus TaxID=304 RepID=A0A4R3V1S9_ROSSA|nr:hypothetical protein [Roseateles saccharophilus]MDG0831402.1 hypothetical protein [Roseateles saccharophilus]TCU98715.1 hypothetical protein EV671_1010164 [Roseateles saccharophilus]
MNPRWLARGLVAALHLALLAGLWLYRPAGLGGHDERRLTTVRLIRPTPPRPQAPLPRTTATPRVEPARPQLIPPPAVATDAQPQNAAPVPIAAPTEARPAEPARSTLRLTLPPGYAASSAAARNPALSDPRSNTPRPTLEDRIAEATGGTGDWVEESTSDNRAQAVGAQGDHRSVFRRGNTCVEVFRSRITDMDSFNGNVAPRGVSMLGKPYKCR